MLLDYKVLNRGAIKSNRSQVVCRERLGQKFGPSSSSSYSLHLTSQVRAPKINTRVLNEFNWVFILYLYYIFILYSYYIHIIYFEKKLIGLVQNSSSNSSRSGLIFSRDRVQIYLLVRARAQVRIILIVIEFKVEYSATRVRLDLITPLVLKRMRNFF